MWRRKVSFWASVVGLAICAFIGLEPILPGPGGCAHIWIFDCEAVQSSQAAALFGVPNWIWGGLWFIAVGVFVIWLDRRQGDAVSWIHWMGFLVISAGLWDVVYLRGIELWVIHAACLECWLVALAAFVAGYCPLAESIKAMKWSQWSLGIFCFFMGFTAAFFANQQEPVVEPPLVLPELPGWVWVRGGEEPFTPADFQIGDPEQVTLIFVYDPHCEDCSEFITGPLQDEMWLEMLADFRRVAVLYDELVTSPLVAEAPRTPALILLDAEGEVITSASGTLGEDELFEIVEAGFMP